MKIGKWFSLRGPGFVRRRAAFLLKRYGLAPRKAQNRIESCLANLTLHGCLPTFLTPGRVAWRYPLFIRQLQAKGAEIAVHGYNHIDLRAIPATQAAKQLMMAAQTFEHLGLESHGFRCPYLSYRDEMADLLPEGLFDYSSNAAIQWGLNLVGDNNRAGVVFQTIDKLYRPSESRDVACVPWMHNKLVEIPVCAPDDLQLRDGLGLSQEGITEAWSQILSQTHKRGELFSLIFHPELADCCEQPFIAVLREARNLKPWVWVARLRDIADWWVEKSKFRYEISRVSSALKISLTCSSRATVLVKGLDLSEKKGEWDGTYSRLNARTIEVPIEPRPLVGVSPTAPRDVVSFLQDQGYLVDTSESAPRCAVYLDDTDLAQLKTQVKLVNWIESSAGPLVRYGRWPDGAKSALCLSGDLDALSLLDYISRVFVR